MAVRRGSVTVTPAEWSPERSLRAVEGQLRETAKLLELNFQTGDQLEEGWKQVTENIFRRAFSSDSPNHRNLSWAQNAGQYNIGGMSPARQQANYSARVNAYVTCLESAIRDLKMDLPEEEIRGVYDGGDDYAFCRDLRVLLQTAQRDVLIVDPYLEDILFDLYVERLPTAVSVRVLTSNLKNNVLLIARKFASGRSQFELAAASDLHDRVLFIDDRCWVIGQSIKDAAKKKTTYIVEHSSQLMRPVYENIWTKASSQVKS